MAYKCILKDLNIFNTMGSIKINLRFHLSWSKCLRLRKQQTTNAGSEVGKGEFISIWNSQTGRVTLEVSVKTSKKDTNKPII